MLRARTPQMMTSSVSAPKLTKSFENFELQLAASTQMMKKKTSKLVWKPMEKLLTGQMILVNSIDTGRKFQPPRYFGFCFSWLLLCALTRSHLYSPPCHLKEIMSIALSNWTDVKNFHNPHALSQKQYSNFTENNANTRTTIEPHAVFIGLMEFTPLNAKSNG